MSLRKATCLTPQRLDARSESPAEENGGETSKSPEQSENVLENKEPAAEGVHA